MSPQNKCYRYWPDKNCTKEYGHICVQNVSEREAQGYYLRELEISRTDRVRCLRVILHARLAGTAAGLALGKAWEGASLSPWDCVLLVNKYFILFY